MGTPLASQITREQLTTAPDHIVEMLARVIDVWTPGMPPQGSQEFAEIVRGQARTYADRIWAEAANLGALWGVARAPMRIELTGDPEQLERLTGLVRSAAPDET